MTNEIRRFTQASLDSDYRPCYTQVMTKYTFPEQNTVLANKIYSGESLAKIIDGISRHPRPFTGFVKVTGESGLLYFLFFLQSDAYAAGKFDGSKPLGLAIGDFFTALATTREQLVLSVHETDPILLKCMLIFLQDEPTAKAPANLIDLEQLVNQILAEAGDGLIILEKDRSLNFFFIKNGLTAQPHWADHSWTPPEDLSATEQLLLYAFESHTSPVVAHIYRNVATSKSVDQEEISLEQLLALARRSTNPVTPVSAPVGELPSTGLTAPSITVEVVSGGQKGARLTSVLPCVIGRKDCDIVIGDALISRRHARIDLVGDELVIEDLGSTNGTFVNGSEVKRSVLKPMDVFALGETTLRLIV